MQPETSLQDQEPKDRPNPTIEERAPLLGDEAEIRSLITSLLEHKTQQVEKTKQLEASLCNSQKESKREAEDTLRKLEETRRQLEETRTQLEETRQELMEKYEGLANRQQDHGEEPQERDAHQPRYNGELSEDTFNFFVFSKPFRAPSFWLALIVLMGQGMTFSLLLASVIDPNNGNNPLGIPANVDVTVRLGQLVAIAIAVITQEDLRLALEYFYSSIGDVTLKVLVSSLSQDFELVSSKRGGNRIRVGVSNAAWIFSIAVRFLEGTLGLVATFILIITQSTVFDLLLNFTAVEYVSQFDDVAFGLAKQGFLGLANEEAAKMLIERNALMNDRETEVKDSIADEEEITGGPGNHRQSNNEPLPGAASMLQHTNMDCQSNSSIASSVGFSIQWLHQPPCDETSAPRQVCHSFNGRGSLIAHAAEASRGFICLLPRCFKVCSFHRTFLFVIVYASMMAGWLVVVYRQATGKYLCSTVLVQFEDTILPELGTFSGLYDLEGGSGLFGHVKYRARNKGATALVYCTTDMFWALTAEAYGGLGTACNSRVKSSPLETHDILEVASMDWFVLSSVGTPIPMQNFDLSCYECGIAGREDNPCGGPERGVCQNNECMCFGDRYGLSCEFDKPCMNVSIDARGEEFAGNRIWSNQYGLLEKTTVYNRPVYHATGTDGSASDVILFTGRRWALFSYPTLEGLDSSFHAEFTDSEISAEFLSEAVDLNSHVDKGTPIGLTWFHAGDTKRHGIEAVDLSQPVSSSRLCSVCDNSTSVEGFNLCLFGGTCDESGQCECLEGSHGTRCEVPPIGNGRCDMFLNTPEFGWDGGDCCGATCKNTDGLICNRDYSRYIDFGNARCRDYTNTWKQAGDLIRGPRDDGTTVALSGSGQTLVIGEPSLGRVTLYDRFGSVWSQRQVIEGSAGQNFGWSIAISSGDLNAAKNPSAEPPVHVAIGEPFYFAENIKIRGVVSVYECLAQSCEQIGADINLKNRSSDDFFGYSVALSRHGNVLAVGAPRAGITAVFKKESSSWTMIGEVLGSSGFREYGQYVDLSADGNVVAIGSFFQDIRSGLFQMVVEVRRRNVTDGSWDTQGSLVGSDDNLPPQSAYRNQRALAMSDDAMVIALGSMFGGASGVQVYGWNGTDWDARGPILRGVVEGDLAGWSVDLSSDGSIVVVGTGSSGFDGKTTILTYQWDEIGRKYEQLDSYGVRGGMSSVSLSDDGFMLAVSLPSANGLAETEKMVFEFSSPRCSDGATHFHLSFTMDGSIREMTASSGAFVALPDFGTRCELVDRPSGQVLKAFGPYNESLVSYVDETCLDINEDTCIFFTVYRAFNKTLEPPGGFAAFLDGKEFARNSNATGFERFEIGNCSCPEGTSRFRLEILHSDPLGALLSITWKLAMNISGEILLEGVSGPFPGSYYVDEACVPANKCLIFDIRALFFPTFKASYIGFIDDGVIFQEDGGIGIPKTHFIGTCA